MKRHRQVIDYNVIGHLRMLSINEYVCFFQNLKLPCMRARVTFVHSVKKECYLGWLQTNQNDNL